jgi:uncharacterized RDD family membrane protein YckC
VTLRRAGAFLIDWLCIIGYAALLIPFGLLIGDRVADLPTWVVNAGTFVLLIVPATIWLAAWERGGWCATPGKRLLGLRVTGPDGPLGWRRSLLRSTLKLALPWELGHTAVYAFVAGANAVGAACSFAAYGLLLWYLMSAARTGRTPYDRYTEAQVVRVQPDSGRLGV